MTESRPLALVVPLAGVQLIEASAGTGKTFTLALLALRLVVERRLSVQQVLAVTFTRAAAQELRERLRVKLRLACELASPGSQALRDRDDDTRLTWALIATALASGDEDLPALHRRLRRAELDIDLAAVFTIDGFCLRVLADEALAAGQTLEPPTLLGSERDLFDEVALEAWRWACRSPTQAAHLAALWSSPGALAKQLPDLVRAEVLLPAPAPGPGDADATLQRAEANLRAAHASDGDAARAIIADALGQGRLNGTTHKAAILARAWHQLEALMAAAPLQALELPDLARLGTRALLKATKQGKTPVPPPTSPLFDAIDAWLDALPAYRQQLAGEQLQLIHDLRQYAGERLAHWKQARQVQGFSDLIAQLRQALAGAQGEALAEGLRARYPVALVDEFQDTDPQQWAIFERLYAGRADLGLFLVGDPKQAIYGFRGGDVHTYLRAKAAAGQHFTLARNFRSRPLVLQAVAEVFGAGGDEAFAESGITFTAVAPGGKVDDGDFRIDGAVAPALSLCPLPSDNDKDIPAELARERAARACARRIRDLLAAGREGRAQLTVKEAGERVTRGVQPADIAVLVSRHQDAARMQQALAAVGVASVAAGKRSLFATDEARELLWLLDAVSAPGDDRRLRTALATVLIGEDASAIAALSVDEARHRAWLDALQAWRERCDRHGPLALISDRVANAGPRLLALADGERRLSNYLQLGEALQEASAAALGLAGLTHWLGKRIAEADDNDETQQLRLESDARLVQIMTLHKSKGLEFPLVFLPFVALPPSRGVRGKPRLLRYHDGERRVTRIELDGADDGAAAEAAQREQQQQRAEQLRLLYVGLTRAQHALWLAWGPVNGMPDTALAWLLHRGADGVPRRIAASDVAAALAALAARAPDAIALAPAADDGIAPRLPPEPRLAPPPLPVLTRELRRDWWVYSFSQLSREEGGGEERGAEDEARPPLPTVDTRFTGARFGNALHTALEKANAARWRDDPAEVPAGEHEVLAKALRGEGYREHELADGIALLSWLVRQTLTTPLPEGIRLCDLPDAARRNEMEFHFAFQATRVPELMALLHAHGVLPERGGFGARQRIEGLMTGKIDLVYEAAGRVYLLDYKSNQLPDYGPATLAAAMRESEYDLQALLYTLALHRWLRFRLGPAYDYDRGFGGVRYLFCRGLDAARADGTGIHASKPPRALIEALDRLLAPPPEASP